MADFGNCNKRARVEEDELETTIVSEEMWNRYKHGQCANLRRDQDTSLKPTKTIDGLLKMLPRKKKKKHKTTNDYHVPVLRRLLSEHQRIFLHQKMQYEEFIARDFRVLIEDIKDQWDAESSSSRLTDYMKWNIETRGDIIGFVETRLWV